MKNKRTLMFRVGTILILLVVAGIMMVIGRGHTVYVDNKPLEYNGQTYDAPYKIVVSVKGQKDSKLRDGDRGMATCIGQSIKMTLTITQEKGGSEAAYDVTFALPYGMDGIAINLPGYLAGLPAEAYMSEFQVAPETVEEESESAEDGLTTDEFGGLGDI